MPLSEEEQRALQGLERALYQQDPEFAHRVRSDSTSLHARFRLTSAAVGIVAGLALIVAFCVTTAVAAGVAGFLVLFASLYTIWVVGGRLRRTRLEGAAPSKRTGRWRRRGGQEPAG